MSKELIVSVAIRIDGFIFSALPPARHGDLIKGLVGAGYGEIVQPQDQGFLTSLGRFASRELARDIAFEAGQLDGSCDIKRLHTEDLW